MKITTEYDKNKIEEFVVAAHKIGQYSLLSCSSGNMSYRLNNNLTALSGSGSWLGEITAQQVTVCQTNDSKIINGPKPTIESNFHLGILKSINDVNVVLHFQSPYATMIACGETPISDYNFNVIIEVPAYIGQPGFVEYFMPGSEELANAVIQTMQNCKMAFLKNHGLVTVGKTFDEVIQRATFFELACKIIVASPNTTPLSPQAIKDLSNLGKA